MTQEEFKKKIWSIQDKIMELKTEIRNVQKEYIESYPIKPGDKCLDDQGRVCWFARICFSYSNYAPDIKVFYSKKDGTPSIREQNAYGEVTKVVEK